MEGVGGIETMGGFPWRNMLFRVPPEDVPDWIAQLKDPSYAVSNIGGSELVDGTPHTWPLQEMKETDGGVEFDLHVWYLAACPPAYVEEFSQHFPVEVRGLLRPAVARVEPAAPATGE